MEEDTTANKEVPVMEVSNKPESIVDSVQLENGNKDEDKNSWDDGEFIKIDRETFDANKNVNDVQVTSAEDGKPSVRESSRELLEAGAKIRELEIELEKVTTALKASESQSVKLKDEILLKEERLEETAKKYEELELNHKQLREQMAEAENNFSEKLRALQDALEEHASKEKELVGIKELYDNLNLDYESSKKKIEGLEQELQSCAAQLEDLIKSSHSKIDDADKKVSEVESLLEAKHQRIQELEGQKSLLESKCMDAESESKKYSGMVSELTTEIEKFQSSMLSLETALQTESEKENALMESLNVMNEEKRTSEEALECSTRKLHEAENLLEALRNELSLTQEKLRIIENDLKASGLRESEIVEKLRSADSQLQQQERAIEEATARKMELQSVHESFIRDFELKMQEAMMNFTNKESEAKCLSEKLKGLEEKIQSYEEPAAEAAIKVASLTEELHQSATKVASLENLNEELKGLLAEAESKMAQSLSENELLAETNSQLKNKVNEVLHMLNSANSEKEATALQLASYMNTITDLTDQHSRSLELHYASEARCLQAEEQLKGTTGKLADKERELKELSEMLSALEIQVEVHQAEACKASGIAESRKLEIEHLQENVAKLADKEVQIQKLNQQLVALEGQVKKYEEDAREAAWTAESRKVKVEELIGKLVQKEDEAKELNDRLTALESQVKVYKEEVHQASGIAESRKVEIEEMDDKLGHEELQEKELSERLTAFESQLTAHQEASREASELTELRKTEIGKLQETVEKLSQKELEVQVLNERLTANESLLKIHQEDAHAASGIAESRKLEIEQLLGMVDKSAEKELEVKELNEKIFALESQLKACQEEASEVSSIAQSKKLEIEKTILQLQDQAKIVEELQLKLCQVETRNEALAEANMKLTQDLALAETEQSDLHAKLSRARDDKDDILAQYELLTKIIEDLTQELTSEKHRLQSEIATVLDESNRLHEAKKELQAVINQLEEQLNGFRGNEDTLKAEITEKSALQARMKELEEQYQTTEALLKDKIKIIQEAATAREADLTSQLEHQVQKLRDRDLLSERVLQLEQELQLARAIVTKQKEEGLATVSEFEASRSHISEQLEAKNVEVSLLGKKLEELEQKVEMADTVSKQKAEESVAGIQEDETEVRSRYIGSMELKGNKSEKLAAQTPSSVLASAATAEAAFAMNFKFILGVALVSIIIGVILGKRY